MMYITGDHRLTSEPHCDHISPSGSMAACRWACSAVRMASCSFSRLLTLISVVGFLNELHDKSQHSSHYIHIAHLL